MDILIILILIIILSGYTFIVSYLQYKSGKEDVIDEMFKNNDINEEIYKKYKYKI